ncbi:MAG: YpdA family putative bacillithiol disulfide reductase [Flavobacteriaceae bacterium]
MGSQPLDVVIIGAGPIGIACALECKKANLSYVVLEKGTLVNSLYNYPLDMTFFSTSEKLEIDNIPFMSVNPKPKRIEALEYYRRVATNNSLNINLFERVISSKKDNELFIIESEKTTYHSKNLIVATGFYDIPNKLNIPGEDLDKVTHYYKEAHYYTMQKVVVVGASNSAVDAALEIWRKGGEVTMVVRGKAIGERVKYWVKPDIENRIKEGSIKAYFESEINKISEKDVVIQTPEGKIVLENDYLIALTGYRPNFDFLDALGISLSKDEKCYPTYDEKTMETNIPGLYLAGVICGGMDTHLWFIENSVVHANKIVNHIISKNNQP